MKFSEAVRDQRTLLRAKHHSLLYTGIEKEVNERKSFGYSVFTATLKIICGIPLFVFRIRCYLWAICNWAAGSFSAISLAASSNTSVVPFTVGYIISGGAAGYVAAGIIAAVCTIAFAGILACVGMAANSMVAVSIPVSARTSVSCAVPPSKTYNGIMMSMAGSTGVVSLADLRCMDFIDEPLPPAAPPPPPPDFLNDTNPGNPQHFNHIANNENVDDEENVVQPVLPDPSPRQNPPPPPPDLLD